MNEHSDFTETNSNLSAKPEAKPTVMLMVDYVSTEFATFEEKPFSDVDALVFAQLAYTKLRDEDYSFTPSADPVFIKDLYRAENFDFMYSKTLEYKKNVQLITAIAASPRFRDIRILNYEDKYDSDLVMQFSAMTFKMNDGFLVAFRGTDSTFTGWKEDFNMTFMDCIPAQEEALLYIQKEAEKNEGSIRICGHSKGGNLAMFAALNCDKETRDRIISVHDLDGPGFKNPEKYEETYSEISDRVVRILPESSIVGLFLGGVDKDFKIVKSSSISVMQHSSFTWKVAEGEFVEGKDLTNASKNIDKSISTWLKGISKEDRETFIDTLFTVLSAGGAKTFPELIAEGPKQISVIHKAIKELPGDVRENASKILKSLFEVYRAQSKT